jgi:Ca-activated chloride channel family protein
MKRSVLIFAACLFGAIFHVRADGFIVVERPFLIPPGHFPFAPLEVSSHHVDVKIDGQVAVTSIDQEFYNPNDQRLEGIYMFPVPKGAHIDKFSMEIGGKMVDAELLRADKARQTWISRKMRSALRIRGSDLFKTLFDRTTQRVIKKTERSRCRDATTARDEHGGFRAPIKSRTEVDKTATAAWYSAKG